MIVLFILCLPVSALRNLSDMQMEWFNAVAGNMYIYIQYMYSQSQSTREPYISEPIKPIPRVQ